MSDQPRDPMLEQIRDAYHVPSETPREAMWVAISGRLGEWRPGDRHEDVIDLAAVRGERAERDQRAERAGSAGASRRRSARSTGWAVAAAAVLVLGVGIGRITAPEAVETSFAPTVGTEVGTAALTLAAREHLGRTESLLTMVRADARTGRIDPATAGWASGLLSQTRLLIDQDGSDPTVNDLLLDLEFLLIQIVGVAETGSTDVARARTELELALRSLEEGEVLPRIQAVLPPGLPGA
jgi:hypothetical protein